MDTVKRIFMWIIILVGVYILFNFLSYAYMAKAYKDIEKYEINVEKPKIEIIENKKTYVNGYIIGKITNNTGEKINKTYLRIDFYNKQDKHLGMKYVEIKDFEKDKVFEFKTSFRFDGVDSYKITTTNEMPTTAEQGTTTSMLLPFIGFAGILLFIYYIF